MTSVEMAADAGVRAWIAAWQDGWRRHDPSVIAATYAEDCRFRSVVKEDAR